MNSNASDGLANCNRARARASLALRVTMRARRQESSGLVEWSEDFSLFWRAIMKAHSFCLLVIGMAVCLIGANPAQEDQAKKDREQMQGTWKAVSGESGGQEFPEDGLKQGNMKMTFKGDRYTFEMTGNQEEGKVKLGADKKPKAIDF